MSEEKQIGIYFIKLPNSAKGRVLIQPAEWALMLNEGESLTITHYYSNNSVEIPQLERLQDAGLRAENSQIANLERKNSEQSDLIASLESALKSKSGWEDFRANGGRACMFVGNCDAQGKIIKDLTAELQREKLLAQSALTQNEELRGEVEKWKGLAMKQAI